MAIKGCKLAVIALLGFMLIASAPAKASDVILQNLPQAQKIGAGRLSYLFWDLYDAALYAPAPLLQDGNWQKEGPLGLELSYLISLQGPKIADSSAKEMARQGFDDDDKLASWQNQLADMFPNVESGDRLTGIYMPNGQTIFYFNEREIGRIDDPEFGPSFFGIWLAETTRATDLRRQLLGLASTP